MRRNLKKTHSLKKLMDSQNHKKTMNAQIMKEIVHMRKKKRRNLKVWGSQAHLIRQISQVRDAKQALNARQSIF